MDPSSGSPPPDEGLPSLSDELASEEAKLSEIESQRALQEAKVASLRARLAAESCPRHLPWG
jgi:hypothetical protein